MLIILEGPDGSGKSSLATALADQLQLNGTATRTLHRGPPEDHPLVEYTRDLESYVPRGDRSIICDRWHWGEEVYGPLYRGGSLLGPAGFAYVDLFLAARGAAVVHVDAETDTLRDRLTERGETFLLPEHVGLVRDKFREVAARPTVCGAFTTVWPDPRAVDLILAYADALELSAPVRFPTLHGYLGPPLPTRLLVGDEPGPGGETPDHVTPFTPYPGTCGRWLFNALSDHVLRETGFINSKRADLEAVHVLLGQPKVVALGRRASMRLAAAGVPHRYTHHPQWWRRFRHYDRDAFLKEVLS